MQRECILYDLIKDHLKQFPNHYKLCEHMELFDREKGIQSNHNYVPHRQ